MHARQRILTNGSFKDGIEIDTKWVVTPPLENFYPPLEKSLRTPMLATLNEKIIKAQEKDSR
jgi:hypothetical protein